MSSIVSPEDGLSTPCNDASWSAGEETCVDAMTAIATNETVPQLSIVKQENDEEIHHYTISLDKTSESRADSEPLTPGSVTSAASEAGSSILTVPCTVKTSHDIELFLENEELWKKFSTFGTEMIITKAGRRMFPAFAVSVTGLQPDQKYTITFRCTPANDKRYKYVSNKWVVAGKGEAHIEEFLKYVHPDSPASGKHWMGNKISFKKIKLTNSKANKKGNVSLNSMQSYIPTLIISKSVGKKATEVVHTAEFPQASFYAVTAYQNDEVTQLKINYNPFAKAFRESPAEQEVSTSYNNWLAGVTAAGLSPQCAPLSPHFTPTCPPASPLLSPHWTPASPLLSAYHDFAHGHKKGMKASPLLTAYHDFAHATYLSSQGSVPVAGPSPLPQFGSVFGSLDTASYAISNPVFRSTLGGNLSHCTTTS